MRPQTLGQIRAELYLPGFYPEDKRRGIVDSCV